MLTMFSFDLFLYGNVPQSVYRFEHKKIFRAMLCSLFIQVTLSYVFHEESLDYFLK